ncbi:MAG: hypothetical protein QOJ42_5566, partial [Acidobacteriaceae bacterium]|nr:hypothetical protein [Acidobacteriaceae bacterium]
MRQHLSEARPSLGLKSLGENPHCVVPSGLDLREIL